MASNADAHVTFPRLLDPRARCRPDFAAAVARISYESASLKINVALAELPSFRACPGTEPGPQHRGTIHICPDLDYIERAYDDAKYGRPSERPVLECTIPSVVDPTVAPPGQHLMSMFVQYAPYALRGRDAGTSSARASPTAASTLLDEYAPNFSRSVLARQVLTPARPRADVQPDRRQHLPGRDDAEPALLASGPVPGYADYRTPVAGLYLCGAAAHPGGGVMGAPGLERGPRDPRAGARPRPPDVAGAHPLEDREQVVEVVGPGADRGIRRPAAAAVHRSSRRQLAERLRASGPAGQPTSSGPPPSVSGASSCWRSRPPSPASSARLATTGSRRR